MRRCEALRQSVVEQRMPLPSPAPAFSVVGIPTTAPAPRGGEGLDPGSIRMTILHPDGTEETGSGFKVNPGEAGPYRGMFDPFDSSRETRAEEPSLATPALRHAPTKQASAKPAAFSLALVSTALLLLALVRGWPYGYFTLLRFAVCGTSAAVARWAFEKNFQAVMWTHGVIAVLFDPFVKVHLHRESWAVIDACVALLMVASAAYIARKAARD